MTTAWYAAFGLLVILVLLNALVSIGMLRQIGVLHQRLRPMGPGPVEGPELGSLIETLPLSPVGDVGEAEAFSGEITLLGFVKPGCSVCATLPSFFRAYLRDRPPELNLSGVLATDASAAEAAALADRLQLDAELPLFRHPDLAERFDFPGSPYVLALLRESDSQVKVLAKGIVNELEQLELLVEQAVQFKNDPTAVPAQSKAGMSFPSAFDLRKRPDGGSGQAQEVVIESSGVAVSVHGHEERSEI